MSGKIDHFLPYQKAWILDDASTAMAEKSRRVGFTYGHAYRSVDRRLRRHTDEYFASRDWESAKLYVEDVIKFTRMAEVVAEDLGEQLIDQRRNITASVVRIKIPGLSTKNAKYAKIMALSSNPHVFRGKGGDITLDEFAFHANPRAVLKAANASAKIWGHQVRIISTHHGESNLYNKLIKEIVAGKRKWSLHHVTLEQAVAQGLFEKIDGRKTIDLEARRAYLQGIREDCVDQSEWDEEYCCIPSSEAAVLLNYDLIGACERSEDQLRVATDPRDVRTNAVLYAGMDIARKKDLTVFWVLAKIGDVFETVLIKQMEKERFAVQEGFVHQLMQLPNLHRLCIDQTGIGMQLTERAIERYGSHRVEGVTFTGPVKEAMGMRVKSMFEDRLVRIPARPDVRESLHKIRKSVTASNNVRLDATHDEAGHADEFWALALAREAAGEASACPPPGRLQPAGMM